MLASSLNSARLAELQGLFLFGEEMQAAFAAAREAGFAGLLRWTAEFGDLCGAVKAFVRSGDLVLIKGSRALELERLVPELVNKLHRPGPGES